MAAPTVVAPRAAARVSRAWQLPFKTWHPLMVYGISRLITARRTQGLGILARVPDAGACAPGGGPARLLGGRAKPEPRPGCRCNGCGLRPDGARRQPLLRLRAPHLHLPGCAGHATRLSQEPDGDKGQNGRAGKGQYQESSVGIVPCTDAKAWGPELRSCSVAYPAYLLLARVPVPSVTRWLLMAFPLMWPFPEKAATLSERRYRVILMAVLAILGLAMQGVWVSTLGAPVPSVRYP